MPKAGIKSEEYKLREEFQGNIKKLEDNQKLLREELEKERLEKKQKEELEKKQKEELDKKQREELEKDKKDKIQNDNIIDEEKRPKIAEVLSKIRSTPVVTVPPPPTVNITTTPSGKEVYDHDLKDDIISCPNCHKGHIHQMVHERTKDEDGKDILSMNYKCTGPECNKEFVMVPKDSDYKCVNCSMPVKRPESDNVTIAGCAFCKGKKSVRFDWSKLWDVVKK